MSNNISQLPGFLTPSKKFALSMPLSQSLQSKIKSQNLRSQLQDRMVDLGNLQTEWCTQENKMRTKSEDLITQLRTISRKYEVQKNEEKAKHLQLLDQINQQHQIIVLDLQSQINNAIDMIQDDDDLSDLDLKIQNVQIEISGYQNLQEKINQEKQNEGTGDEEEELSEKYEMLENRLNEMQNLYLRAVQAREDESKSATHQLEELILKQQDIDQQNQLEIQQLVDQINSIDREHSNQIADIKKQEKEIKRRISHQLKSSMNKASQMQQEISKYQHDHKKEMNLLLDEENQFKQTFLKLNSQNSGYLNESSNAVKKYSDETRRIAAMKHEIEELNAELLRESIEHANLIKMANKIDDDILNQIPQNQTSSYSLSFSYNRF